MRKLVFSLIFAGGIAALATPAAADVAALQGKSVKIIVPYAPAGSYDLYARLLAEHMRGHLPGAASMIVQNMPGAGGMIAVQNLFSREPQDGTSLAIMPRDVATNQLLRPETAKYDASRFGWIGSICAYSGVLYIAARVNVRTPADLRSREIVIGAWGQGTESFTTPTILNAVAGTKFKITSGYGGGPEVDLAVERGEADGRVASWTFLKTQKPAWLKSDFISMPFQTGLKRHPELPDVPLITELAQDDDGTRILQIMNADAGIGWSFATTPNVAATTLALLRDSFSATMKDAKFQADAEKRGLEILPSDGRDIQNLIETTLKTPAATVTKLKTLLGTTN